MYSKSRLTNAKNLGKRFVKAALGRDHLLFSDTTLPKIRLGTEYGGWFVAPGALPRGRRPVIMSFGIGDDISFDIEMISRYDAIIYAFDPTPKSIDWLATQAGVPEAFAAFPCGVADYDGVQSFSLPTMPDWDDYSVRRISANKIECTVKRIGTLIDEIGITHIDVIKMDVEGSEYGVLKDFAAGNLRPAQLLVEFHHGRDDIPVSETTDAVARLRGLGYRIFDVSPWGREFSFVHQSAVDAARQKS
jgi:FkbM family methyltransferase